MANDITLSAGVRSNLLQLQTTADLIGRTQTRLATGKKVNSALDNPSNFFTSQALQARAGDLSRLLDSVGNAIRTIEQADNGIKSLTKLVESAQATARQALQAARPTATYDLAITGTVAIEEDTAATTTSGETLANVVGNLTASSVSSFEFDASDIAGDLADGDTLTITYGDLTFTFESDEGGDGTAGNNIAFTNAASLVTAIETAFGDAVTVDNNAGVLTISGTDYTTSFTAVGGGAGAAAVDGLIDDTNITAVDGDTLTITVGGTTSTFRYVDADPDAAAGTFTDIDDLVDAITAADIGVTATADNGALALEADETSTSFTLGGTVATELDFASATVSPTNDVLGALDGTLTVQVGTGATQTLTFGTDPGEIGSRAALVEALSDIEGITAEIDEDGFLSITANTNTSVTIGGTLDTEAAFGIEAGTTNATATVTNPNATRASLESDFNTVISQINQLVADTSYNGVNLLNGDNLTVLFNEDGSSSLQISGVTFDAEGLGLEPAAAGSFQNDADLNGILDDLGAAINTLRTQASRFGSNLSIVQTRQEFTKAAVNTLQVGADQLVLADTNEEGANLLALQTRQQLSTTALSLASQADQNVLRLF